MVLLNWQVPLGMGITWAAAFLLTEAGAYSYKGCDINVPASNIVSEHCRKHISRMKHCRVDTSHALKSSPWFRFPYPLQWGTPVFSWKMAFVMCVVSLIASVDSVSFLTHLILCEQQIDLLCLLHEHFRHTLGNLDYCLMLRCLLEYVLLLPVIDSTRVSNIDLTLLGFLVIYYY